MHVNKTNILLWTINMTYEYEIYLLNVNDLSVHVYCRL